MVFCSLWFFAGLLNWSCRLFFLLLKRRYADYALINTILISAMNQMEKILAAYRKASKQWCSTQNKLAQGRAWSRAPGPPQAHPIFASLCGCVNLRNDPFSVFCNEILQWGNGAGSALWLDKTCGLDRSIHTRASPHFVAVFLSDRVALPAMASVLYLESSVALPHLYQK